MRLSGFNLYVPDYPEPGTTLVYNTFSGAFVSLDPATLAVLKKADAGRPLGEAEQALVDPEYFDDAVGIMVEDRRTEEVAFRDWFERSRSRTDRLHCIVSTSFACNFACTYCYQDDVMSGKTMDADTGARTAAWIAERALEIGAREVALDFIGGEPLLHPHRVEQIVTDVRDRTAAAGVRVTFHLTTNGYFLTRELVERWRPLGLKGAQITIDGDETTHSHTRRSKKGEDTFARLLATAVELSTLIAIRVNGNYQHDTVHGFAPLVEKLREAGFQSGSQIQFKPAVQGLGVPSEAGLGSCLWSGSSPEIMTALGDVILRNGFTPPDSLTVGPCSFHFKHSYSIDPEGHIYKCPGFLGKPEWAVGHVRSGLTPRYVGMANINPQRSCGTCAHRPECVGGCVAAEWVAKGIAEGVACEIQYFEANAEDLLKRKYVLATTDTTEEAVRQFPPMKIELPRPPGRRSPQLKVLMAASAA